jgi:hypothetical protein
MGVREIALSTRFARALSPNVALDTFHHSSAKAVVLDRDLDPIFWPVEWGCPVLAVESPCPKSRASAAILCSTDRDEARTAVEAALDTLRRAAQRGAHFLALQLGEIRALEKEWVWARERFLRAELDEKKARLLMQRRRAERQPALDVARRSLEQLSRVAEAEGLTLALANGRRFIAMPDAEELDLITADLSGAPLVPLFDVAAAHLPDVMGLVPFQLTQAAFGQAPLVYVGDACGPIGGLPPGSGQLDVSQLKLLPEAQVVFSPWSGLTVEESLDAVEALQKFV